MNNYEIPTIIENRIVEERTGDEMTSHRNICANSLMTLLAQDEYVSQLLNNYYLGNKEVNKIKRLDPAKMIIDAADINWDGFTVNYAGNTYRPHTTLELLDIIFRLIQRLFEMLGEEDVIWNDAGRGRDDERYRLDWADPSKVNDNGEFYDTASSKKTWETSNK